MLQFDPSEISNWAALPDANHQLPILVRRLILATISTPSFMDIPGGSAVWRPGWDGLLATETGNPWAPPGVSCWEFGCQQNPTSKASSDYTKRTDNPLGFDTATSTFIFVTPRQWSGKQNWVQQRQEAGEWAEVRAFDASDLVAWLEQAPAVATWFARLIGKLPDDGYTNLDEWWENWSTTAQPSISPNLVLAGRQESADKVCEWFRQAPSHYYLQGHTREEAIAFVAALAITEGEGMETVLLSRALVVKSENAWASLVGQKLPLVLIRAFDGNVSPQVATNRGHHVLTPMNANEEPKGNGVSLPALGRDETVNALTEMGLSETRARSLSRKTARRLQIIRRFLIEEAGGPKPDWAAPDVQSILPSLILIGAWDESNENDKDVVSEIAGRPYEEVEREVVELTRADDSPVTKIGSRWRFLSHDDAWHLLAPRLTSAAVDRFEEAATKVLGAENPEYEMPLAERPFAGIRGKAVPHSHSLREGIAQSLALMSAQGERTDHVEKTAYLPEVMVRRILTGNERWQIWASLSTHLTTLAEAAPTAMLDAIERDLDAIPNPFAELFAQEGAPIFGGAPHTSLLWALEKLAWSPEYFSRVAHILARLVLIDPGGNLSNRPAASIRAMFLPWFRVSETSDAERLETLETLLTRVPDPGWKTLIKAYPSGHDTIVGREPPSFRPWGQDGVPQPTWEELYAFTEKLGQLLLEHVGSEAERWRDIIDIMESLSPTIRKQATEMLAQQTDSLRQQPASLALWKALRAVLNRHRSFPDSDWAMPAADLEPLAAIYQEMAPDDPVTACVWLFEGWPKLPEGTDYEDTDFQKVNMARQFAIAEAYKSSGIGAILSIAEAVEQPAEVGQAFANIEANLALELALEHAGSENQNYRMLAYGIFWAVFRRSGWEGLEEAITRLKEMGAEPQALAQIYLAASSDQDTWHRLDEEDLTIQRCYWELLNPWTAAGQGQEVISFVAEQLLDVHRSPAVADFIAYRPVNLEAVIRTLEQLPADLAADGSAQFGSSHLSFTVAELLKKLDSSEAVSDDTIATLELPFISMLDQHERPNLAIYRVIAKQPEIFADLVALAFKRDDGQIEDSPAENAMGVVWDIVAKIMFGEGEVPGTMEDGTVDYEALSTWVKEARRLCAERGRAILADQTIGQLLAGAPAGADGVWPCEAVRDLLDDLRSEHIGIGFTMGKQNRRGVTSRGAFDGGGQEWSLVSQYREHADKIRVKWPHTASLLQQIAQSYRSEAQRIDRDAYRHDQFGF